MRYGQNSHCNAHLAVLLTPHHMRAYCLVIPRHARAQASRQSKPSDRLRSESLCTTSLFPRVQNDFGLQVYQSARMASDVRRRRRHLVCVFQVFAWSTSLDTGAPACMQMKSIHSSSCQTHERGTPPCQKVAVSQIHIGWRIHLQ